MQVVAIIAIAHMHTLIVNMKYLTTSLVAPLDRVGIMVKGHHVCKWHTLLCNVM